MFDSTVTNAHFITSERNKIENLTAEEWVCVLKLSTMWNMRTVSATIPHRLTQPTQSDFETMGRYGATLSNASRNDPTLWMQSG